MNLFVKKAGSGLFVLLILVSLDGCTAYFHQPTGPQRARLGEDTPLTSELHNLPPAKEKIVAAVYKFRDQTGQYKQSEAGSTFSTAISQGTTNILLKALEESGWFVPIERENVGNLLNERKIVRSSVAQFKEGENLPPLLFAGIILEGGIVSYDANIITGGAGLRYFSAGGSTQYRQDRVTVYLRAVATRSGKILKTVYTSKTILSQSVDASLFRYVTFKRLLEAETGFTTNEPSQLAVTEAVEKAVHTLIIEGVRDGLWAVADKAQADAQVLLETYQKEKTQMSQTDVYGMKTMDYPASRFTIQPYGAGWSYQGDLQMPQRKTGYGVTAEYYPLPSFGLQINAGTGILASQNGLYATANTLTGSLLWRPLPYQKITPIFLLGAGLLERQKGALGSVPNRQFIVANAGVGVQYSPRSRLGLRSTIQYYQPFSDELDGRINGQHNDYVLQGSLGVIFHLGRQQPASRQQP